MGSSQARDVLTQSGLPMDVLSKIWELSDIDRDGCLSLGEFCIAFHLTTMKMHMNQGYYPPHIPTDLPTILPDDMLACLSEFGLQKSHPPAEMTTITNPHLQPTLISCDSLEDNYRNDIWGVNNGHGLQTSLSMGQNLGHAGLSYHGHGQAQNHNFTNAAQNSPQVGPQHHHQHSFPNDNLEQDQSWETFSDVDGTSTISSVSLVKFAPPGFPSVFANLNPNVTRPMALRPNGFVNGATPTDVANAQLQLLAVQQQTAVAVAALQQQQAQNAAANAAQNAAARLLPGVVPTAPMTGPGPQYPTRLANGTLAAQNQINAARSNQVQNQIQNQIPNQNPDRPEPSMTIPTSVEIHQNKISSSASSSKKYKESSSSTRKDQRRRQNSSSSSIPMMPCENPSEAFEKKREMYQRIAEGGSSSENEEEGVAVDPHKPAADMTSPARTPTNLILAQSTSQTQKSPLHYQTC